MAPTRLAAECVTLVSGPVVYDVAGCKLVEPEPLFDTTKDKYSWIANLDAAGKKKFYDSYRGLYLKGKVVKSKANSHGLETEKGALGGDTIFTFVPPSALRCDQVLGKRLAANLREICCEGGGEAPCLLDTSYELMQAQLIGAAASAAGDQLRMKAKRSKDYQAADVALRGHHWKEAVAGYEKCRQADELDHIGYYHLGLALRELDQCSEAIAPLRSLYEAHIKKETWADEEGEMRKAIFLLARCYSKMNNPSEAVLVLNGYLLEPQKYREEIQSSLKHKDFGWIHTSKQYRDYEVLARKKLNQPGPEPAVK